MLKPTITNDYVPKATFAKMVLTSICEGLIPSKSKNIWTDFTVWLSKVKDPFESLKNLVILVLGDLSAVPELRFVDFLIIYFTTVKAKAGKAPISEFML